MTRFAIVLLITAICGLPTKGAAQSGSAAQDTLAFRTYFGQNSLEAATDFQLLKEIYALLADKKIKWQEPYKYWTHLFPHSRLPEAYIFQRPFFCDNPKFPQRLERSLRNRFAAYWDGRDKEQEKTALLENLLKFDAESDNKPLFFSTIYTTYQGDFAKYVDDLYDKSIMGSKRRLRRFCNNPTAKKLQKDLSVQFAVGLALYELWIDEVRKGDIAAK